MAFADNLKQIPGVENVEKIDLYDGSGKLAATVENKPGKAGSLAVYNQLLHLHGKIDAAAAREGLTLFAEHAQDARDNPGKHPNIDRLLEIIEKRWSFSGRVTSR